MNNTAKTGLIIGIVALIIQILIMVDISNDGKLITNRLLYGSTEPKENPTKVEFYTTMVLEEPSKPGWSVIEISNKYNELPTGNYSKHEAILKKINGKTFIIHDDRCKYCKEKEE